MATTYDKASLVMIPSGVKEDKLYSIKPTDGSGDFTFSRGSDIQATRVNSSGLIEKAKVNLLLQSNQFDTTWGGANFTLTSGQADSDGGSNAWLYNATGGSTRLGQSISTNGVLTMSLICKYVNTQYVWLKVQDGATPRQAWFDIQNGNTAGATGAISSSMTNLGGGWYRCEVAVNSSATSYIQFGISTADSSQSSTSGNQAYVYKSQLNHGLIAQDYVETTTTAVVEGLTADLPRLDYSGGASCPSLLLEPSRTNALAQSEYFGASWTLLNATQTPNDTTSPEGVTNATRITDDATSGIHGAILFGTWTSSQLTASFFVKAGTHNKVCIGNFSTGVGAFFDLSDGTIDGVINAPDDSSIEPFGTDGWYRITMTQTGGGTFGIGLYETFVGGNFNTSTSYVGSGEYLYVYGAQLEAGSYPTSYIPTYSAAANRGADFGQKASISSLFGATATSFFIDFEKEEDATGWTITGGNGTKLFSVCQFDVANSQRPRIVFDDGVDTSTTLTPLSVGRHKIAVSYSQNDTRIYIDGTLVLADTSCTYYQYDRLGMNATSWTGYTNNILAANINQFLMFPTALTNAELAALTTI